MSYFSFNSLQECRKCAVIGCNGQGAAVAHALAQSGLPDSLVLIDPDLRLARGQAADISGALPMHSNMDIWAGDMTDLTGCMLIVLALGASPVFESAHADLVALNSPVLRNAALEIVARCPDACVVVLSHPVDVMTHTVLRYAGLPHEHVMGIGTLPYTLRLQRLISKYVGADPEQVLSMVLGEQSEHATVCWSTATACTMPLDMYLKTLGRSNDAFILHSLFDDVISAHNHTLDAKGNAEFANAAAVLRIADAILHDRNCLLTLCTKADGYCDLDNVCLSLPCIVGAHGARIASEIQPAPTEILQLQKSASRIRSQLSETDDLLSTKQ